MRTCKTFVIGLAMSALTTTAAFAQDSTRANSPQGTTSSSTIGTDLTGLRRCDLDSRKWTPASQSQLRPT